MTRGVRFPPFGVFFVVRGGLGFWLVLGVFFFLFVWGPGPRFFVYYLNVDAKVGPCGFFLLRSPVGRVTLGSFLACRRPFFRALPVPTFAPHEPPGVSPVHVLVCVTAPGFSTFLATTPSFSQCARDSELFCVVYGSKLLPRLG